MLFSTKTKISLSLLGAVLFTAPIAMADYTAGPYINSGVGGTSLIVNNGGSSSSGGAARLGIGYVGIVGDCPNPFLLGFEVNGDYAYTNKYRSLYGMDFAGIIGKELTPITSIIGKLGANTIGDLHNYHSNIILGPQVGVGLGYQITPPLRVTLEGDYALDAFRINSSRCFVGSNTVNTFTYLIGLQYSFAPTNPGYEPAFVQIPQ